MADDINRSVGRPLPGFAPEEDLAAEFGVNPATIARKRKAGACDYYYWGGKVHDHRDQLLEHIRSQVRRRNPPRRARRSTTNHPEI
jgi:hypothetical protein